MYEMEGPPASRGRPGRRRRAGPSRELRMTSGPSRPSGRPRASGAPVRVPRPSGSLLARHPRHRCRPAGRPARYGSSLSVRSAAPGAASGLRSPSGPPRLRRWRRRFLCPEAVQPQGFSRSSSRTGCAGRGRRCGPTCGALCTVGPVVTAACSQRCAPVRAQAVDEPSEPASGASQHAGRRTGPAPRRPVRAQAGASRDRSSGMGSLEPQPRVAGSVLPAPRVPRPRTASEDAPAPPVPRWPAADRFADRTGLASTQARLLLAVFCGLAPDHAHDDPSA